MVGRRPTFSGDLDVFCLGPSVVLVLVLKPPVLETESTLAGMGEGIWVRDPILSPFPHFGESRRFCENEVS